MEKYIKVVKESGEYYGIYRIVGFEFDSEKITKEEFYKFIIENDEDYECSKCCCRCCR